MTSSNSNSVIISKLLSDEGNNFSSDIENFLNIKFNELKEKLNNHIQEKVNENIDKFYNTPNDIFENELFNKRNEIKIVNGINITDKKYFEILNYYEHRPWNGGTTISWLFYKNFMLKKCNTSGSHTGNYINYTYIKHNIPNHILYIVKHFNYNLISCDFTINLDKYFQDLADISLNNNKIFYPSCLEFEKKCEDEYEIINDIKKELENKKDELNNLIEEQKEKINYYKELEDKNKSYEEDKKSFYEMKNNLLLAKEKIKLMKDELLKEKELFENEKKEFDNTKRNFSINKFDIDEFLDEKAIN